MQVGAQYLEKPNGGRGILLGGVPGVAPANVVILGGGVVGTNAAKMALGLGAHVTIIDRNLNRLRDLDDIFNGQVVTLASNAWTIRENLKTADLVVGAVLIPGASAPKLVKREMIAGMKRGAVVVDVAIDQGGCFETSHATTHSEPVYVVDGVVHYCVSNMPAAVPHTSTFALTNATFPFLLELANHGLEARLREARRAKRGREHLQGLRDAPRCGRIAGPPVVRAGRGGVSSEDARAGKVRGPAAADRVDRGRETLPVHRAQVRPRANPPVCPRDGRSRRFPQRHPAAVFRHRSDGHRDPGRIRRAGRHVLSGHSGGGRAFRGGSFGRRDRRRAEHHLQQRPAALGQRRAKDPYLPRLAENTVASYALSEAGSGSDAFALATRAEDQGGHFLLNGRKLWITNAAEAGLFLLFANANPAAGYKGITAFLVERDFPGFQVGKKEDKLGLRASSTCELILDNCRVPRENVMGEIGKGYKIAIETLNEGRIAIGGQMIGLARARSNMPSAYAKQRKQFGKRSRSFRECSSNWPEWPPRSKPRGCWCTTRHACATPACLF